MDVLTIYRAGVVVDTIKPDDSSVQYKKVMGENELRLQFSLSYQANFAIGDYTDVFGERYKINQLPIVEKISTFRYEYTMTMQGLFYDLTKVQYFFLGDDNTYKEPDFSLMGNGDTFIDLLITNLARTGQTWIKGQVIPTVYKNITFSATTCYDALAAVAQAFDTEYWFDGNKIHLTKIQKNTGQVFQHGRNKGLYSIIRQLADDASLITRLYVYGSDKNLPADYRNFSKRLLIPAPDTYLEANTAAYGIIESTTILEDIYPHRTGTVSAVDAGNIFHFKDASIDFNVNNQLLPGASAKVTFNTGQLAGYTFEISRFDNATKEFTILLNKNETAYEDGIPNSFIRPGIGDEYVITDIQMPQIYIDAAEAELKAKAEQLLTTYSEPVYNYKITFDPVYLRNKKILPVIGNVIWLKDTDLKVNQAIRIIATTRSLVNENEIEADISDIVSTGVITKLSSSISATSSVLNGVKEQVATDTLISKGTAIGDLKIKQGTLVASDITTPPAGANLRQVYVDINTGKFYYQ